MMIRIPKSDVDGFYKNFQKDLRPKGSTKNLGQHEIRHTFKLPKSILQNLEAMAYWQKEELLIKGDPRGDDRISVRDVLVQILKKYFRENPVKDLPESEYLNRCVMFRDKVYKKAAKTLKARNKGRMKRARRQN